MPQGPIPPALRTSLCCSGVIISFGPTWRGAVRDAADLVRQQRRFVAGFPVDGEACGIGVRRCEWQAHCHFQPMRRAFKAQPPDRRALSNETPPRGSALQEHPAFHQTARRAVDHRLVRHDAVFLLLYPGRHHQHA